MIKKLALIFLLTLACQVQANVVSLPKNSYQYKALIIKEGRAVWGQEANIALFAGQFHQESMWNNNAKSYVGAKGLGQFMPGTAKDMNARYDDLKNMPIYSSLWSIRALYIYDRDLYAAIKPLRKASVHSCSRYAMMLSSYNGGLGWLNRDRKLTIAKGKNPDIWWDNVELYSGRASWAIKENRDYPIKIMFKHAPLYLAHGYPGVPVCQVK
jgi:membrane-bound lytic murein transglycosylase MltF